MKIEKYYTSFTQVPLEIWRDEDLTLPQKSIMNFIWSITAHKDDNNAALAHAVMTNTDFWGQDLTEVPGFEQAVVAYLDEIDAKGTYEVMKELL